MAEVKQFFATDFMVIKYTRPAFYLHHRDDRGSESPSLPLVQVET